MTELMMMAHAVASARRRGRRSERTEASGHDAIDERERRQAAERVRELRSQPESWGLAATDSRYGSPEVVWQLLEAAKREEPLAALRLVNLAGEIAAQMSSRQPGVSLWLQLWARARCARANSLLDMANRREAARELRHAGRLLTPELGHGRALYCHALGRLRAEGGR
jgi:hypothetical protein